MSVQYISGSILSVDSNQNVKSKTKNVESKIEKCVVHTAFCIYQEIRKFWAVNCSKMHLAAGLRPDPLGEL